MKAIIIHGTEGSPEGNWFPWLKDELEILEVEVSVPRFPTPENQSLENWMKVIDDYSIDEDTILIGHSLGPAFILSLLEKYKAKAAFLVAGFVGSIGAEPYDTYNKSFCMKDFDWDKIKQNCKKFVVINGEDDPYVPLEKGRELAEKLGTDIFVIKNAGHLNEESGFTRFDFLLEKIKELS